MTQEEKVEESHATAFQIVSTSSAAVWQGLASIEILQCTSHLQVLPTSHTHSLTRLKLPVTVLRFYILSSSKKRSPLQTSAVTYIVSETLVVMQVW